MARPHPVEMYVAPTVGGYFATPSNMQVDNNGDITAIANTGGGSVDLNTLQGLNETVLPTTTTLTSLVTVPPGLLNTPTGVWPVIKAKALSGLPMQINCIGDSITFGNAATSTANSFVGRMTTKLQSLYGSGGSGWHSVRPDLVQPATLTNFATLTDQYTPAPGGAKFGSAGQSANGNGATATWTGSVTGNQLIVAWASNNATASIRVAITGGGGPNATFPINSTTGFYASLYDTVTLSTLYTNATVVITVISVGTGLVNIFGMYAIGNVGVTVHNFGLPSQLGMEYLTLPPQNPSPQNPVQFVFRNGTTLGRFWTPCGLTCMNGADIIILAHGVNDYVVLRGVNTPAGSWGPYTSFQDYFGWFKLESARFNALIGKPAPLIIVVTPAVADYYDEFTDYAASPPVANQFTFRSFVEQIHTACRNNGLIHIDLAQSYAFSLENMEADSPLGTGHPNNNGHLVIANQILGVLGTSTS